MKAKLIPCNAWAPAKQSGCGFTLIMISSIPCTNKGKLTHCDGIWLWGSAYHGAKSRWDEKTSRMPMCSTWPTDIKWPLKTNIGWYLRRVFTIIIERLWHGRRDVSHSFASHWLCCQSSSCCLHDCYLANCYFSFDSLSCLVSIFLVKQIIQIIRSSCQPKQSAKNSLGHREL